MKTFVKARTINPLPVKTHFQFPDDEGSFASATLRCVGVGKCRRTEGGTMCPSFMVTREEKDTTRGRAHLLFEMLQGNPLKDSWRDGHVKDALDLCLACKGCKGDCPVNVDMATYKAEFLSHYYKGRLRPITGYSMGLIYWWARLASLVPEAVNSVTQTPGLRTLAKLGRRFRTPTTDSHLCHPDIQAMVPATRDAKRRYATSDLVARYLQ